MIRFNGTYAASSGTPGSTTATFTIYASESSNVPLWSEVQGIDFDKNGSYSVLLGATSTEGIPASVFQDGQTRWLEVDIDQVPQPRVALVSVPYALKASDADTLGGLPASEYLRASTAIGSTQASSAVTASSSSGLQAHVALPMAVTNAVNGSANYLAMFSDSTDIVNSLIYQSGNTVSIGGTDSLGTLTLIANAPFGNAGAMALYNMGGGAGASVSLDMYNTSYNGGIPQAKIKAVDDGTYSDHLTFWTKIPGAMNNSIAERMRITSAGNVGIGTTNPQQALEVNGNAQIDGNMTVSGNLRVPGLFQAPNDNSYNFGTGIAALSSTTSGIQNTAVGSNALKSTTSGSSNTALGNGALSANTTGTSNTAVGAEALPANNTGSGNVAIGAGALLYNGSGNNNIAVGYGSGGYLVSGSQNIYVGSVPAPQSESGVIRIGNSSYQSATYIAGIFGTTTGTSNAIPVVIDANGQLGTISSSRRYKEDIRDMGDASSGLMRLRPVTFRYKKPYADGSKPIQYGLIAEEVAEVYPELVARSSDGQIETVKYDVLDSMLLNEVQKLRAVNAAEEEKIRGLEERLSRLEAQLSK